MTFLTDHTAIISLAISIVLMFFGLVATWTKMRDKIDTLTERATDNRNAIQKSFLDLKELFLKDLSSFKSDHDRTRQILSDHIMDSDIHQTPGEKAFRAEWRDAVMNRLQRIEEMISEIHKTVKLSNMR